MAAVKPLYIFLSMLVVKILDTTSAWLVYLTNPVLFVKRETNRTLIQAFTGGLTKPFLALQLSIYLLFFLVALSLWKLSEGRESLLLRSMAVPPALLGLLVLHLYPVAMATNIVNGMLSLPTPWPLSKFIHAMVGFPLTFIAVRFGWNIKNRNAFAVSFLGVCIMGLLI